MPHWQLRLCIYLKNRQALLLLLCPSLQKGCQIWSQSGWVRLAQGQDIMTSFTIMAVLQAFNIGSRAKLSHNAKLISHYRGIPSISLFLRHCPTLSPTTPWYCVADSADLPSPPHLSFSVCLSFVHSIQGR